MELPDKLEKPISDLLDEYISELTLEASTIDLYRKIINLFITWLDHNKLYRSDQPTRAAFSIYYKKIKDEEKKSPRTVDLYTAVIRGFFKWLVKNKYYNKDITEGTTRLNKSSDYVRAPLEKEQLQTLLTSLKKDKTPVGKRDLAIINLLSFLGLRRNEVSLMDVQDIIEEEGMYYIRVQGKGHVEKDTMLPATREIINPIYDYWKIRPDIYTKESPAFVSHANCGINRLDPSFFSKMAKRHFRQIGLDSPLLTCHSLRHFAAFMAVEAGANLFQVNQMLRHKNMSTSEQYLKGHRRGQIKDGTAIFKLNEYYKKFTKTRQKRSKNDIL
jgi:integrase/recombinase XerC